MGGKLNMEDHGKPPTLSWALKVDSAVQRLLETKLVPSPGISTLRT